MNKKDEKEFFKLLEKYFEAHLKAIKLQKKNITHQFKFEKYVKTMIGGLLLLVAYLVLKDALPIIKEGISSLWSQIYQDYRPIVLYFILVGCGWFLKSAYQKIKTYSKNKARNKT